MERASHSTGLHLEVPTIPIETALVARDAIVIDLRSESEYDQDHIPGAHSVPLFDDAERALVGTLYHRQSPESAFRAGAELVAAGIDDLLRRIGAICDWDSGSRDASARIEALTQDGIHSLESGIEAQPLTELPARPVLLHCWRGGLRSQSVIGFCRALGLDRAVGIEGGYKSYRRHVIDSLEAWQCPPAYVIRGLTGVGKTLILRELEALEPSWTIDLEGCAGHRSSLLGMVGLKPCSQKTFETRLANRIRDGFDDLCVFEGESRKVGDAIIPRTIWEGLTAGVNIKVTATLERRIEVLSEDYLASENALDELPPQLEVIEQRLNGDFGLVELLRQNRTAELVEILLEHYYDPLYRHSEKGRTYAVQFESEDAATTARQIRDWILAQRS